MTKPQIKNIITKTHFNLLFAALLNYILKITSGISLNYRIVYFMIILIFLSGIVLFFWNIKPFNKIGIYFSYYVITPIFYVFFWLFNGIFLALITTILLYPVYPRDIEAENEKIIVYNKYNGFMGACCFYEVNEKKFWILEKKLTEINLDEITSIKNISIESTNDNHELKIKYNDYNLETNQDIETDTTLMIITE